MYHEIQRGDMCRLHSLNAYFGYKKLEDSEFFKYCDDYDSIIEGLNSRDMDGFAEGRCIINYIIDVIDNKYTLTIPIDLFKNSREYINIERYNRLLSQIECYFEFNKTHVWFNKKDQENKWWKIDSISGIHLIDPKFKKNGYIIVFDNLLLIDEIDYYRYILKKNTKIVEVYWCNLYHSVKLLEKKHNILINIKKHLKINIDFYRKKQIFDSVQLISLKKMMHF
jgi:hypothetical protein